VALIGFTRVSPPDDLEPGDDSQRAPLSRGSIEWVPCAEVNGEGVFIRLPEGQVAAWEEQAASHPQIERLVEAHRTWRLSWGFDPEAQAAPLDRTLPDLTGAPSRTDPSALRLPRFDRSWPTQGERTSSKLPSALVLPESDPANLEAS
jgi:hypothetical protein